MKGKVAPLIKEFYPQYFSIEEYPAARCAAFSKVSEPWGEFSNFGKTPIVVNEVEYSCVEKLFQCLKFFETPEAVVDIFNASGQKIKMKAKKWDKAGATRSDWGKLIVDAMKYCLNLKYEQIPAFRDALEKSKGLHIVEDQSTFAKKEANAWGCKLVEDKYVGPNLMGRLLMELRDNGIFGINTISGISELTQILRFANNE